MIFEFPAFPRNWWKYIWFQIPLGCTELHHEIELGVVIGSCISRASPKDAFAAIGGYALVLDMTVRDFQVINSLLIT